MLCQRLKLRRPQRMAVGVRPQRMSEGQQEAAIAAAKEEGEPEGHGHVRLGHVGRWVLLSLPVKYPLRRSVLTLAVPQGRTP